MTGQPERVREREEETLRDIVCGRAVTPSEAVATRVYKGEARYFCCTGCAEAFEANPEAYIGTEPIRAYRLKEKMVVGPDPARVSELEAEQQRYQSQIQLAEQRARSSREDVNRLRPELDDAQAALDRRSQEQRGLSAREAELRAMPEADRVKDLQRQLAEQQRELEAAERALAQARRGEQAFLLKQRAEASDLAERERMLQGEIRVEEQRTRELEQKTSEVEKLRGEWAQVRDNLAKRRQELESVSREEAELRARAAGPSIEEQKRKLSAEEASIQETIRVLAEAEKREQALAGTPEARRAAEQRQRLSQARRDLEQAQKELAEARSRVEAIQAITPADIATVEQRRQSVEADIRALETRARDLEGRVQSLDRMQKALADARASLGRNREDLQRLAKRDEEIQAALRGEDERVSMIERQATKERTDVEEAQRALAEARLRNEEMLRARRAEIAELRKRMQASQAPGQERRVQNLEARINQLQKEADDADRRAGELRDAEKRTRDELIRVRREREFEIEGLPATEGEYPVEFYRTRRTSSKS